MVTLTDSPDKKKIDFIYFSAKKTILKSCKKFSEAVELNGNFLNY